MPDAREGFEDPGRYSFSNKKTCLGLPAQGPSCMDCRSMIGARKDSTAPHKHPERSSGRADRTCSNCCCAKLGDMSDPRALLYAFIYSESIPKVGTMRGNVGRT